MIYEPAEAWLLATLYAARGGMVPVRRLLAELPGRSGDREAKHVLKQRIYSLRQKFGREDIVNHHGKGFSLSSAGVARVDAALSRAGEHS